MITIISGTNRPENVSLRVSMAIAELLTSMEIEAQILDLQKLPKDFVFRNDVFGNPDPGFSAIVDQFISTANRFVFVVPEYNGSFPGVCKAFIDAVWPEQFKGKKAALVGLSSGRAGNLRGLDQLTGILHYLEMPVLPKRVNLIHIESMMDVEGKLIDEKTIKQLNHLLQGFTSF